MVAIKGYQVPGEKNNYLQYIQKLSKAVELTAP